MTTWNDISLYKFNQINDYWNRTDLAELDRILFCTCVVFDKTDYEINNGEAKEVNKLITTVKGLFATELKEKPCKRMGWYNLNYDVSTMTFGQYVELSFFLQQNLTHAHYSLASISNKIGRKHKAENHSKRADYFLKQPIGKIAGSIRLISERMAEFNAAFKHLFGLSEQAGGATAQEDRFNKRYGWTYAATSIRDHQRITLEQVFALPVKQALNDLAFLKEKSIYEAEQIKKK